MHRRRMLMSQQHNVYGSDDGCHHPWINFKADLGCVCVYIHIYMEKEREREIVLLDNIWFLVSINTKKEFCFGDGLIQLPSSSLVNLLNLHFAVFLVSDISLLRKYLLKLMLLLSQSPKGEPNEDLINVINSTCNLDRLPIRVKRRFKFKPVHPLLKSFILYDITISLWQNTLEII